MVKLESNKIINKIYKNINCDTLPSIKMDLIFEYVIENSMINEQLTISCDNIIFCSHLTDSYSFKMYQLLINLTDDSDALCIYRKCINSVNTEKIKKECLDFFAEKIKQDNKIKEKNNEIIELKKIIADNTIATELKKAFEPNVMTKALLAENKRLVNIIDNMKKMIN
jgi:hypothetical protein